MQCIQKKALAHDSACWVFARGSCNFLDLNIDPLATVIVTRAMCTGAQEMCEIQDRGTCYGNYPTTDSDYWKAMWEVGKCLPFIGSNFVPVGQLGNACHS